MDHHLQMLLLKFILIPFSTRKKNAKISEMTVTNSFSLNQNNQ